MKIFLKRLYTSAFFRPFWYAIIINPYFIARQGLYREIKTFSQKNFVNKRILDIGCGIKPYQNLFAGAKEYIGADIEGGGHASSSKNADVFFDGVKLPFPDNSFDVVLCTQVLEHTQEPYVLLQEMSRVLVPKGDVFITMPFVWNEHEIPYDFKRFTRYEHQRVLASVGFDVLNIKATCGVFSTCGQLISAFIFESIPKRAIFIRVLVSFVFCFPVQVFFLLLDAIFINRWITLDYIINAQRHA